MKNECYNKVTVAIADDHEVFRIGMKQLVNEMPNARLLFESQNGKDLIAKIPENIPDIIFIDINIPILNGIETARIIRKEFPTIKIVVLTASKEILHFKDMVKIGIQGFIHKSASKNDIITAINQINNGITYISNDLFDLISEIIINKANCDKLFSQREFEILQLICKGFETKEIANKLFLSQRTIEKHKSNMLEKTRTNNTIQLLLFSIRNNYLKI